MTQTNNQIKPKLYHIESADCPVPAKEKRKKKLKNSLARFNQGSTRGKSCYSKERGEGATETPCQGRS